jgi:hypothetical protein
MFRHSKIGLFLHSAQIFFFSGKEKWDCLANFTVIENIFLQKFCTGIETLTFKSSIIRSYQ